MSTRMTKSVKAQREKEIKKPVTNFMGGTSYELNPFETMKMVTASSIFGEPQYYRNEAFDSTKVTDGTYYVDSVVKDYLIESLVSFDNKKTSEIMEEVIDASLKYDYENTLLYAVTLRKEFLMRLNPQIIMVRAVMMTEERKKFTEENPGKFNDINMQVMSRADDVIAQVTYYMFKNGSKKNIPNILKRSWANKVKALTPYEVAKYKDKGIGLIDTVRICHANNETINELMKTGTVAVADNQKTWERLRSAENKTWSEILDTIKMPHMALLRNLRGIFSEISDMAKADEILDNLVKGVENGKQFPYRYLSAFNAVNSFKDIDSGVKGKVLDSLEDCMDKACENLPKLKGKNVFLSDNSGSAWGACPSEYGTMTVAKIDNLSSVIGAANSDDGTVVKFGDRYEEYPIRKRKGILDQAEEISKNRDCNVGGSTEGGIWKFLSHAIDNKIVYDNIFIYSDMQAGHGGLYGEASDKKQYMEKGFATRGSNIDVAKVIDYYRQNVNPKVNVYCVQTAGYTNVLLPENGYRTSVLYGWTGKELVYAKVMNDFWDEYDAKRSLCQ